MSIPEYAKYFAFAPENAISSTSFGEIGGLSACFVIIFGKALLAFNSLYKSFFVTNLIFLSRDAENVITFRLTFPVSTVASFSPLSRYAAATSSKLAGEKRIAHKT